MKYMSKGGAGTPDNMSALKLTYEVFGAILQLPPDHRVVDIIVDRHRRLVLPIIEGPKMGKRYEGQDVTHLHLDRFKELLGIHQTISGIEIKYSGDYCTIERKKDGRTFEMSLPLSHTSLPKLVEFLTDVK